MAGTAEELSVNYEEDGVQIVKELDKRILSKGKWTTILFRYQEWNRSKGEYGPDKFAIRRYEKSGDEYRFRSKFVISSPAQAEKIIAALNEWIGK